MTALKSILGIIFLFSFPALALDSASSLRKDIISVRGEGRVEVMPDMAFLGIAAITEAREAKQAQEQNAIKVEKIIRALQDRFEIKDEDIQTAGYSLIPLYEEDQPRQIIAYRVTHSLEVRIFDLNLLGRVIDEAGIAGADSIPYIQFGLKEQRSFEDKALQEAMADAYHKAQVIAATTGREITRVHRVSQASYQLIGGRKDMGEEVGDTEIRPKMVTVEAELEVEFEF